MQRTKIFLIRHGETESNSELRYKGQEESPLSKKGIAEAKALAKILRKVPFTAIYCSTLGRAVDTAKIISKFHHDLSPIAEEGLMERFYGDFENKTFTELKKEYPKLYKQWLHYPNQAPIPNAETLEQLQARGIKAVQKIIKKHAGKTICIVAHGGINRAILFHFLGLTLDNFFRIKQDNSCINIIEVDERGPMVALINSTAHLGERRINFEGRY